MSLIPELLCSLVLFTENRIIHHGSEVGSSQWVTPFYQVKSDFYLLGCISQTFQSYTWIGYLSDAGPKSNIRYSKNKLMCSVRQFSNSRANTASRKLTAQGLTVWMYFAPAMQTVSLFFLFSLNRTKKCVLFSSYLFFILFIVDVFSSTWLIFHFTFLLWASLHECMWEQESEANTPINDSLKV